MKRAAFSLVEVLVSIFLVSLLMACVYSALILGMRCFSQGSAYNSVQQEARKGMVALVHDFTFACSEQINCAGGANPYAWFLSADAPADSPVPISFSPSGSLVWRTWAAYTVDSAQGTLIRSTIPLISPTDVSTPAPLPAPSLALFQVAPLRKVVARSVLQFSVTPISATRFQVVLQTGELPTTDRSSQMTLRTELSLRNQ